MPEYSALPALLPIKLEVALVKWIRAKRAALFVPQMSIVGAHEPGTAPAVPWMSVYASGSRVHPQFSDITGAGHPKICTVDFSLRVHKAVDFYETASKWAGQLYGLLAEGSATAAEKTVERTDFLGLMADLNAGGTFHPADGLHVHEVADAEESLGMNHDARLITFALEFTAEASDPAQ